MFTPVQILRTAAIITVLAVLAPVASASAAPTARAHGTVGASMQAPAYGNQSNHGYGHGNSWNNGYGNGYGNRYGNSWNNGYGNGYGGAWNHGYGSPGPTASGSVGGNAFLPGASLGLGLGATASSGGLTGIGASTGLTLG
jgi:hypothetical protein